MSNTIADSAISQGIHQEVNDGVIDYDIYIMSKKERILYILLAAAALFALGFIFYQNLIIALLICPFALLYPKMRTKEIIEKRKLKLNLQFKDMLYSLSSSVGAGKPIEAAFRDILKDLSIIYPSSEIYIIKETDYIVRRLSMNEPIEEILENFAARSHLEDVQSFVNVLKICNRKGGNLVEVIRNTSQVINDKIETKNEIETLLSQKRFEQKVLSLMPIALIVLLSLTQGDYMHDVFHKPIGRVVMTVAIIMIGAGYLISKKIMNIKI